MLERWLFVVPLRLRSLFRGARVEQELQDELQFHQEGRRQERAEGAERTVG